MTDQITDNADRQKGLNAAYTAASKRLRENNRDEFNALYAEEAKARNIDWSPKPTAEQKAADEVQRLLREYPGLAEKIAQVQQVTA